MESKATGLRGMVIGLRERYERSSAARALRVCSRVGARPVLRGRPVLINRNEFVVGDDFALDSSPIRSHLVTGNAGVLRLGNRVSIGAGAAISCEGRLDIGDDVTIGSYAIILDSDYHVAENRNAAAEARPIAIGRGAQIGHRVVILPGSNVGEGARVLSGSVVSGDVAAHAVVEGNPARSPSGKRIENADGQRISDAVPELVKRVLRLKHVPELTSGPEQIPEWDSLGALRLVLALEERFAVTLADDQLRKARSIRELVEGVEAARKRSASGSHSAR